MGTFCRAGQGGEDDFRRLQKAGPRGLPFPGMAGSGDRERRDMDKGRKLRPARLCRRLKSPPVNVIAQIPPRIARQYGRASLRARGGEKAHAWNGADEFPRRVGRNRPRLGRETRRIRKTRQDIAGGRLDAHLFRLRRDPEHQQDLRLMPCDQRRQVAIDRRVARREDMADEPKIGESRAPLASEGARKRRARIESGTGKTAKTRDQNRSGAVAAFGLHRSRILTISSTATMGERVPAATAVSIFASRAFTFVSPRSRAKNRSSSMDRSHLTCCSLRFAANSPDVPVFARCSVTAAHNSAIPSPVSAE